MRTYTSVVSDLTPGQVQNARQEFKICRVDGDNGVSIEDRLRVIAPVLDDEAVSVLVAGLTAEAEARGE